MSSPTRQARAEALRNPPPPVRRVVGYVGVYSPTADGSPRLITLQSLLSAPSVHSSSPDRIPTLFAPLNLLSLARIRSLSEKIRFFTDCIHYTPLRFNQERRGGGRGEARRLTYPTAVATVRGTRQGTN